MERQTHYAESGANPYTNNSANPYGEQNPNLYAGQNTNPYAAAQLQLIALQRMQQNSGVSRFPGRTDTFVSSGEQINMPPKAEETRDKQPARGATPVSAHPCREAGHVNYAHQPLYDGPKPVSKGDVDKYSNIESRLENQEEDMEIGYEDKPSAPTLESLEQRFIREIMQLVKEQCDAEDAENARHRQKLVEINCQHQERLTSLRAQQSKRREEFLRMEAQTRLHQYQEARLNLSPVSPRPVDSRVYASAAAADQVSEAHRGYPSAEFESHRDRTPVGGVGRNQGTEERVPIPRGRVYNNAGSQYYR